MNVMKNWLEKNKESFNDYYKTYRAEWCRQSGLPMMDKSSWEQIQSEDNGAVAGGIQGRHRSQKIRL